jgi:predicted PurR-regulated permease PerM
MDRAALNRITLLVVVLIVSMIFLTMIRGFLLVILLAGVFSAMAQPLYHRLFRWLGERRNLSSATTLILFLLIVILPLGALLGVVTGQAIKISNSVGPWIAQKVKEPSAFDEYLHALPFYDTLNKYQDTILQRAGELVGKLSTFLFESLSSVTLSTVNFLFLFFMFLYTMYFFIKDGDALLKKILYYLPLTDTDEKRLLGSFVSVTRATIKGVLLIGIIQGTLAGVAFWVVGIDSAVFWGTIMTVLSVIPVVGSSLVWFPAVVILAASGHFVKAIGLWVFCGLLVGSVDNVLRPRLVGKDTKLHDLFILFGTLGGISLFGVVGFIVGPIIAALFVTVWEIYGETFREYLPGPQREESEGVTEGNAEAPSPAREENGDEGYADEPRPEPPAEM